MLNFHIGSEVNFKNNNLIFLISQNHSNKFKLIKNLKNFTKFSVINHQNIELYVREFYVLLRIFH